MRSRTDLRLQVSALSVRLRSLACLRMCPGVVLAAGLPHLGVPAALLTGAPAFVCSGMTGPRQDSGPACSVAEDWWRQGSGPLRGPAGAVNMLACVEMVGAALSAQHQGRALGSDTVSFGAVCRDHCGPPGAGGWAGMWLVVRAPAGALERSQEADGVGVGWAVRTGSGLKSGWCRSGASAPQEGDWGRGRGLLLGSSVLLPRGSAWGPWSPLGRMA